MKRMFKHRYLGRLTRKKLAKKLFLLFIIILFLLVGLLTLNKLSQKPEPIPDSSEEINVYLDYRSDNPNKWLRGDDNPDKIKNEHNTDQLSDSGEVNDSESQTDSKSDTSAINDTETLIGDGESDEGFLDVHFIDVGQGDSILTVYKDGDTTEAMLIDAGDTNCGTLVRNYITKQGIVSLKSVVCTHPDADHIGGMASVIENLPIESTVVWSPSEKKDTKTYDNLVNEIDRNNYKMEEPEIGKVYSLGEASFMFLAPTEKHKESNSNSLVLKLWYGDISFLLTGDCDEEEEQEIENGPYIDEVNVDVLKVGHHGSKTSSSKNFLQITSPTYAVVSCGEDNTYGHPSASALLNIRQQNCELFRTDVQGTIIATTDGKSLKWNASPCNDWTQGE